ncbi:hypothetical protein [Bradyrhizobium sp. BR 1433]|uniref:hypothetical protein n=1 Tax=Bradyrhizobium sp. BR 1433 TaxID=3447967 RepID=UPI003EE683EA
MVATGVSTFMSPCLAVAPATKEIVPETRTHQRRIARPVRVVDHFVQHHLGVRSETEHGAVDESDAERRVAAGLHHVTLVDVIALVQDDRDAVADGRGVPGQLGDMADDLGRLRRAAGLGILGVAGECVDEIAGEMRAVRRRQRRALLALEIVVQDEFPIVLRDDEVEPGPLEVAGEQQLPIVDDDRAGRSMRGNAVDVHISTGISVRVRQQAVEFLDKVHCGSPHES